MNRRQTKKALTQALRAVATPDQDIPTLVADIQRLAVLVNKETEFCVFTSFYGHTDGLNIQIAKSKSKFNSRITDETVRMASKFVDPIRELLRVRKNLEHTLATGTVDWKGCEQE